MKIVYAYFDNQECFYIGIGNPSRAKRHSFSGRNTSCYNRILDSKKRGSFSIQILHSGLSMEMACWYERAYILSIGRKDKGKGELTNRTNGGQGSDGYKHNNKSREKMRAFQSNRQIEPNKGKSHTKEAREKISEKLKGRKLKLERVNKSVANNTRSKQVKTPLGIFRSSTKAAEAHGVSFTTIIRWCADTQKPNFIRG